MVRDKLANLLKIMTFWKKPRAIISSHQLLLAEGIGPELKPQIDLSDYPMPEKNTAIMTWVKPKQVPDLDFGVQKYAIDSVALTVVDEQFLCTDMGYVVIYENSQTLGAVVPYMREFNISGALGLRNTSQLAKSRMEIKNRAADLDDALVFGDDRSQQVLSKNLSENGVTIRNHLLPEILPTVTAVGCGEDYYSVDNFIPPKILCVR